MRPLIKLKMTKTKVLKIQMAANKVKKNYVLDMTKKVRIGFVKGDAADYFLGGGQSKI